MHRPSFSPSFCVLLDTLLWTDLNSVIELQPYFFQSSYFLSRALFSASIILSAFVPLLLEVMLNGPNLINIRELRAKG